MGDLRLTSFTGILLVISFSSIWAQQALPASGGNAGGIGGSASYSVGQVAYTGIQGEGGYAGLGMQQPYTIIMVGNLEPDPGISVSFYPNPVQNNDFLIINMDAKFDPRAKYSVEIRNIYGQLLISQRMDELSTAVPVKEYQNGIYLMRILKNDTVIKLFKVIKTD